MDHHRSQRDWLLAVGRQWPEILLVLLGTALRVSMLYTYDVRWGYDFTDHWTYVEWFSDRVEWPSLSLSRAAYHPPLYYLLAAWVHRAGVPTAHMNIVSIVCGSLRLLVLALALARILPRNRPARLVALAIAAILPASVHIDGMVSNEGLSNLLSAIALLLMIEVLRSEARRRWWLALTTGAATGLCLLAKISGWALVLTAASIALVEFWWVGHGGWPGRGRRLLPWLATFALAFAISAPHLVHNYHVHGKAIVTGFDGESKSWYAPIATKAYLERRQPSFYYGWTNDIYEAPYFPTGIVPVSYFWPPLIASTFVDYYSFGFAQHTPPAETINTRPVPRSAVTLSSFSMMGGTWIAVATLVAWLVVAFCALRTRNLEHLLCVLLPLIAVAGQLQFAVKFAIDAQGPIKGAYLQFAALPLCGLFGLAATWGWRRGWPERLAGVGHGLALLMVALYCLYARLAGA
jgi:hypothetical protein